MAPGARSKFGAPIFEPEDLRKQMYCNVECMRDIVAIFWRPRNHSAPRSISAPPEWSGARVIAPLAPSLRPCWLNHNAACEKLQMFTFAKNLPLCDKNALNVLD